MRAKNTTIASIYISFNVIEVFRPRYNVDMQFSERYSQPLQITFVSCQQQLLGTRHTVGLPVVQFLQGNLEWQELTKPNCDQNWKTSKPNTLTSGFTNSPEFNEAYRFKLLKSLMNLGKSVLIV